MLVALEESGLAYTAELPAPALHPVGKIPALRDGDVIVPDSSVICVYCVYLERKHPTPSPYPEDPTELGQALFLAEHGDAGMTEGWGGIEIDATRGPRVARYWAAIRRRRHLWRSDARNSCTPGIHSDADAARFHVERRAERNRRSAARKPCCAPSRAQCGPCTRPDESSRGNPSPVESRWEGISET